MSWFRWKTVTHGPGLCHRLVTPWTGCLTAAMSRPLLRAAFLSLSPDTQPWVKKPTSWVSGPQLWHCGCSVVKPFLDTEAVCQSSVGPVKATNRHRLKRDRCGSILSSKWSHGAWLHSFCRLLSLTSYCICTFCLKSRREGGSISGWITVWQVLDIHRNRIHLSYS